MLEGVIQKYVSRLARMEIRQVAQKAYQNGKFYVVLALVRFAGLNKESQIHGQAI